MYSRATVHRMTDGQFYAFAMRLEADPLVSGALFAYGHGSEQTMLIFGRELNHHEKQAAEHGYRLGMQDAGAVDIQPMRWA